MDHQVEGGGLESLPVTELQAKLQECYDIEERRRIRVAIRNAKIRALEAPEPALPAETLQGRPAEPDGNASHCEETKKGLLVAEDVNLIDSEDRLRSLLYSTSDYEEKKKIRAAIRELRRKKGSTSDVALSDASTSGTVSPTASVAAVDVVTTYTRSRGDQQASSSRETKTSVIADGSVGVDLEPTEEEVCGKGRQRPEKSIRKEMLSADEPRTHLITKAETENKMNGSARFDGEGKDFTDQAPQITRPLQDTRSMDGSHCVTLSLEFRHSGTPLDVNWFKDGDLLTSCDDFEQAMDATSCRLIIKELFPDDAGLYRCTIRNKFGEAASSAQLTVEDNPSFKPPEFVVVPRDVTIEAGKPLEVHVEIRGSPEPSLSWFKDNNILLSSKETRQTLNSGMGTLLIYDVTLDDGGVYRCLASNAAGESEACFSVRVHARHTPSYSAPKLSALLEDLTVPDGASCVTLSCALESRATFATVSWYKGSKKLRNSKDFLQTFDGLQARLVIAEIYPDDAGIYKCIVAVGNTELTSEATLTVTAGSSAEESCGDSDAEEPILLKSTAVKSTASPNDIAGSPKPLEQGEIKTTAASSSPTNSMAAWHDPADREVLRKELATCSNGISTSSNASPLCTLSSHTNGPVNEHTDFVHSHSLLTKPADCSSYDTRSSRGTPVVVNGTVTKHVVTIDVCADLANAGQSEESSALSRSTTVDGTSTKVRLSPVADQDRAATIDVTDDCHPSSSTKDASPISRGATVLASLAVTAAPGNDAGIKCRLASGNVQLESSSCAPSAAAVVAAGNRSKACTVVGSSPDQSDLVLPALPTTAKSKVGERVAECDRISRHESSSAAASRANPASCPTEPLAVVRGEPPTSQERSAETDERRRFGHTFEKGARDTGSRAERSEHYRIGLAQEPTGIGNRAEAGGSCAASPATDRLRTSQVPTAGGQQVGGSVSARAERFRKAEKEVDAAAAPVPRPFVSSKVLNSSQRQPLLPASLGSDKPAAESTSGRVSPSLRAGNLLESRSSSAVETCSPAATDDAAASAKVMICKQGAQNGHALVLHPTGKQAGVTVRSEGSADSLAKAERDGRSAVLTDAAMASSGAQIHATERTLNKHGAATHITGAALTAGVAERSSRPELSTTHLSVAVKSGSKPPVTSVSPPELILPEKADSNNNYAIITDENELQKILDKTEDFDERKKIRARIREVKELRKTERENEFRRREEERVAQERKRQADAELAKKEKLDKYREFAKTSIGALPVASDEMAKLKITEAEQEKKRLVEASHTVSSSTSFAGCGSKADEALKLKLEAAEKSKEAALKSYESVVKKEAESKKDISKAAAPTSLKPVEKKPSGTAAVAKPAGGKVAPATGKQALAAFKQMDKANNPNAGQSRPKLGGDSKLMQVADALLRWCRFMTRGYENINIENYTTSWNDGMAFCALIHHFYPDSFDYNALDPKNRRHNFTLAFETAEQKAGITQLLDVEDMVRMLKPDWKCVLTYIQTFYSRIKELDDAKAQTPTGSSAAAISAASGSD